MWVAVKIMLSSMMTDICDEDELKHNMRREGMFGGVFAWVEKMVLSLAYLGRRSRTVPEREVVRPEERNALEYRFRWYEVKSEPGELKVVTRKKGKPWAEQTMRTTRPASQLKLTADRQKLAVDGSDLAFVTVAIADADGQTVPRAKQRVHFTISGPGDIIAVDNGDPTSQESFQAKERKAFNGLCLVIVRTRAGQEGEITLQAQGDGMRSAHVTLTAAALR
jgi:beta-galactosidase